MSPYQFAALISFDAAILTAILISVFFGGRGPS